MERQKRAKATREKEVSKRKDKKQTVNSLSSPDHDVKCKKPFERLWISSMEDAAVREGFARLRPGTENPYS